MKKNLITSLLCVGVTVASFAQPIANFSGSPTTICAGQAVTWTNLSQNTSVTTQWAWQFPGANPNPTSTSNTPGPRTYPTPGVYNVVLTATNNTNPNQGTDVETKVGYITVLANPNVNVSPSTGYVGCTITSANLTASGAQSYVWSPAGTLSSSTGTSVVASSTVTTNYNVVGTSSNGCTDNQGVTVMVSTVPPNAPASVNGTTTVCSGQSGVTYTVPGITPPVPIRNWTVPPGATITSGQGTRSITVTFGSTSGNVCCNQSNACGASADVCLAVTVDPTPAVGTVGSITGPTSVCDNQTGVIFTVAPVANASSYTWTENSDASIVSGQGTNTITVNFGTNNNTNICVSAVNSCNTSTPVCLAVVASPSAPGIPGTISGPTTVCSAQGSVIYSVATVNNAAVYTWTVPAGATVNAGQGTKSVTVTFGATSGSVCVTAGNGCGTSLANCVNVTVDPTQAVDTVTVITGPIAVCANQTGVLYSIPTVANATTYNWIVPTGASITAGAGTNSITVSFGTSAGNVCVDAANGCSTSPQKCKAIVVSPNAPGIPGGITGLTTVCSNVTGIKYSVSAVANATTYSWTVPTGATITAGQGTNSITVSYAATSGSVCVTAGNACGTSLGSCASITVDPASAVGIVGSISGPVAVCANQTGVAYSIATVSGATTYNWTVPAGANITAGSGTNSITVTFATAGGNVCVDASNACSTSPPNCVAVAVDPSAPAIPGGITGSTTVCSGQLGEIYTIASVPNTSVYTWTVPAGASVVAGQGTNTATIDFGATSGTICVTAGNACGTSIASCQTITVDPNPAVGPIGAITGPQAVCANQSNVVYSTTAVSGATNYNWTVPSGANITAGAGTATITVTFGSSGGNVCVDANNSCSATSQICEAVTVASTAPAIPAGITGVTTVCSGQIGEIYTIASVPNATVYTWTVPTGGTVTAGQGTTSVSVTYGTTSGNICVTAGNACGTSIASCQAITVDPNPAVGAISTINGPTAACANQSNVTYILPAVANASTYNWTVPTAANITAGQGTNTITVSFGNISGNICVNATNSCGSSPQSCIAVTVSPNAPAIPAGISGATTVCSGQVGNYSIAPVANATTYTWSGPTGATVSAGQGTVNSSITLGTTSGNICVTAGNGCGTSLPSCLAVTVNSAVLTVTTTSTPASCSSCCDGTAAATQTGTSPFTYAWSPAGGTASSASGLCVGSYTVCVTDAGGCITCSIVNVSFVTGLASLTDNGTIKVYPNPANEYINIEGTLSSSANLDVSIVNMFGQTVLEEVVPADGTFTQKVNIANIPSGVYFIRISSGEFVKNTRMIKIQ